MRLGQASTAEQNAAFDVVNEKLHNIIEQWVPGMFQGRARQEIESVDGRRMILAIIDAALDAAEKARAESA